MLFVCAHLQPMWSEDNQLNEFLSRQSTRVETKNLKTSSANSRRTVPSLIGRQESTDNLNSCVKLISGFSSEFSSEDSNEYDSGKPVGLLTLLCFHRRYCLFLFA